MHFLKMIMNRTWSEIITITLHPHTNKHQFSFTSPPFYYLTPPMLFSWWTLLQEKCKFQWYSGDHHGKVQGYLCLRVPLSISHTHTQRTKDFNHRSIYGSGVLGSFRTNNSEIESENVQKNYELHTTYHFHFLCVCVCVCV